MIEYLQKSGTMKYVMTRSARADPASIAPLDLGQTGLDFIQATLKENGPLPSRVAELFGTQGPVFALLPAGTSLARAEKFDQGGLMPMGTSHRWFADHITARWRQCQLLFEDCWGFKQGDALLQKEKELHFFINRKVFFAPNNPNVYDALDVAIHMSSFLVIGFIVSPPVSLPASGTSASSDDIKRIARNVQAVFVSAYDEESYVVWEKQA